MKQVKLYKNSKGETLYPACNWYNNQHKIHYWYTKASNAYFDENPSDKDYDFFDEMNEIMDVYESSIHNGLVYATYKMCQRIKELITCYDIKHAR